LEDIVSASVKEKIYHERLEHLRSQISEIEIKKLEISEDDKYDRHCDPNKPVKINFNDISAAAYRIKGGVEITPCTVRFNSSFFLT
jgi:hypothetical protein